MIKITIYDDLLPDGIDRDALMAAISAEYIPTATPSSDVPVGPFDTIQELIDTVRELEEHGFIVMGDQPDTVQEALDDLQRWCNDEAYATDVNFKLWQAAREKNDELRAEIALMEYSTAAANRALDDMAAEFDNEDKF